MCQWILIPCFHTSTSAQVPWARLGQEPVVAEFDRLYILAEPNSEESSQQVMGC